MDFGEKAVSFFESLIDYYFKVVSLRAKFGIKHEFFTESP